MSLEKLSLVLWRERELLQMLLFKLEEERLLLAAGRTRWLAYAAREIETVLDSIAQTEVLRATTADAVATFIGLPANPSLRALALLSDEPWRSILSDHRDALLEVTAEITHSAAVNRKQLVAGVQAVRTTLLSLDRSGSDDVERSTAVADGLLDEVI